MRKIKIFDTTLRDGEQAPGCSMTLSEKIEVAKQLEALGVDVIEAGFAISSPGDFKSVEQISKTIKTCTITSLARATQKDITTAYEAVKAAAHPRIHIFLATSPIHMEYKLKKTPQEVLCQAAESVAFAKTLCEDVEFSAEDATRSDPIFLAKVLETAIDAGATVVNVPDTVGYATPDEMFHLITNLKQNISNINKADLSVHCHNDLGMAVANSLAAVQAGASQIECAVNGIGERAGNAALEELVMALKTRKNLFQVYTGIDTKAIYRTSKLVYYAIGQTIPINKAVVGQNAFVHESGVHQHGVMANRETYEIMSPEDIGLVQNNMVLGKHSGKHALESRLREMGYHLTPEETDQYFERFKKLCDRKKTVTDRDLEAMLSDRIQSEATYHLAGFEVHTSSSGTSSCIIRLTRKNETYEEISLGDGPIDAAYNAIDKIVGIEEHTLEDYNIHSVSEGKDALGEVIVKLRIGTKRVTGRGLSTDVIESSILAYLNGIHKLIEMG